MFTIVKRYRSPLASGRCTLLLMNYLITLHLTSRVATHLHGRGPIIVCW